MNTSTFAALLGGLALGGVVLLYVKVEQLDDRLTVRAGERIPSEARRADAARGDDVPAQRPLPGGWTPGTEEIHAGPPVAEDADADTSERIRALERELAELRAERETGPATGRPWTAMRPAVVRSVEQLAERLELTPTQVDRVQDTVERSRRRIEDVWRIPDETGVSPWERRRQRQEKMRAALENSDGGGVLSFAMGSLADRNRKIPGRGTTYGEEIDRIGGEAREEIGRGLSDSQREEFEHLRLDPLLDEGGGSFVSISMTGTTGSGSNAD